MRTAVKIFSKTTEVAPAGKVGTNNGSALRPFAAAHEVEAWLAAQALAEECWLLAHSDEGVVWGRLQAGKLVTSAGVFAGKVTGSLHPRRLQQCRLFGPDSELRLWRTAEGWHWQRRLDADQQAAAPNLLQVEVIDEAYLLWGTRVEEEREGFSLLADGAQGLRHAVPLLKIVFGTERLGREEAATEVESGAPAPKAAETEAPEPEATVQPPRPAQERPVRLLVRHYLVQHKDDGTISIATSRLCDLRAPTAES